MWVCLEKSSICCKTTKTDIDLFLELYEGEWSSKVTSQALQNLSLKKHNKAQILPLTKDLQILRVFLMENITALTEEVRKNAIKENWRKLATFALARLIIFNKRRGGETSRMTLSAFQGRPMWETVQNEEIIASLSPAEKELSKRFGMVEIVGKRNRKVPVLLIPDVKDAIIALTRKRKEGNVSDDNPYVFALNDGKSTNSLRGNDVIRQACSMVDLQHPDVIISTNLRKYIATVSQLVDILYMRTC